MVATGGLGWKAVSDKGEFSYSFENAAGDVWNSKLVVGCSVSVCERDQVGRLVICYNYREMLTSCYGRNVAIKASI